MKEWIAETFRSVGERVDIGAYYGHARECVMKALNNEHFFSRIDHVIVLNNGNYLILRTEQG